MEGHRAMDNSGRRLYGNGTGFYFRTNGYEYPGELDHFVPGAGLDQYACGQPGLIVKNI